MRFRARLVACVLAACSAAGERAAPPALVLRLSASGGLADIHNGALATFSTHLVELVLAPLGRRFARIEAAPPGPRLALRRRSDDTTSTEDLARALRCPGLVSAIATSDGVVVEFADSSVFGLIDLHWPMLDEGPYVQESFTGEVLALRRRVPGRGPQRIVVHNMPTQEEAWRRFLAREVDLVPAASPAHARYLREVPSVRLVPVAQPYTVALFLRVASPPLADVRVRRGVALALRRGPLAEVVVGDPRHAVGMEQDLERARALLAAVGVGIEHPLRLRAVLPEDSSDLARAALVVQQQLAPLGVELELVARPLMEIGAVEPHGGYDATLLYGSYQPRDFQLAVSGSVANLTGYANPEFDAAVAAGDQQRARAILEADVPYTPLFAIPVAVAMDRRLCGARPKRPYDLGWLADVHPCAPGEDE